MGRDQAAQQALRSQLDSLRQQAASHVGPAVTRDVAAAPAPSTTSSSAQILPSFSQAQAPSPNHGPDIHLPQGGGGGAIDPITALLGVGLAGLACIVRRNRHGRKVS